MNALLLGVVVLISNFIPMGMPQTVPPSKCVMQGLFPIDDGTCQNYYMCIFDGAKFAPYGLKCAGTTLFDPSLKYCTSDYFCTQITSSSSASTSAPTSPSGSSSPSSSSASTSAPTSPSGSSSPSSSSASTSALTSPSGSSSPSSSSASTSTPTSPSATSSTSSSTTTSKPTTALPCNGRYPLPDTKCQKYYFCFTNGVTTTRYNLTCPNSLLFNPDKQKCVLPTAYSCPPVV
ncbi:PREDICTED: putative protein TPRXL [Habropoda laboriosa]|uniref:putative protein TPRXL n=1 Tax=Habropoda laboriosa TaxID=597456 RepID=UPI00083DE93D|nr:PREDICTED: putative protein TPRXL [Habropoda laboriosa]